MSASVIVSYDGSDNDDDGLSLARLLKDAGLSLALAYVRHSREFVEKREEIEQFDAEKRLDLGAARLGDPDVPRSVLVAVSTPEGLLEFAGSQGAPLIVFGSDYRTPPGHAQPGRSAQHLLETGTVAIAVAAAGLRVDPEAKISTISVLAPNPQDNAAQATAEALAAKLGATVVGSTADLIVVGSPSTALEGHVALTGATRTTLDGSRGSVLVVPRGKPLAI